MTYVLQINSEKDIVNLIRPNEDGSITFKPVRDADAAIIKNIVAVAFAKSDDSIMDV